MLQPKRMKFRKMQKGRNRGLAERGSKVSFGEYALKATGRGRITISLICFFLNMFSKIFWNF